MMKVHEYLTTDFIYDNIEGKNKREVLEEIVKRMAKPLKLDDAKVKRVVEALLTRESYGSTGIGRGVAIPHAKIEDFNGIAVALGVVQKGVDFDAIDGADVDLLFVVISNPLKTDEYLNLLKKLAQLIHTPNFCSFLRQAKTIEDKHNTIVEFEEKVI
ncbi:MAG: PTS sugar transporter subunit IIA [Planctomycetota bacterium]